MVIHLRDPCTESGPTSHCSFSALSKPNFASTTRWKALDEIYKIYMLLHRSDLNSSLQQNFVELFVDFSGKFAKVANFPENVSF